MWAFAKASCKPEENIKILLQKIECKCVNWVTSFKYPLPKAALHIVRIFKRPQKSAIFYKVKE
jgi:hypothetical protein